MHNTFENELWDKPNSILMFNDTNASSFDKFQKFIGDFCKSQSLNIMNQKRLFDKFLSDNVDLKNSEYSFSNCNYILTEKLLEILNIYEIFNDALLNEVDEMIKNKLSNIKKETKNWKNEKRKLFDDLNKENMKHDSEFKRYCSRFNAKEVAYSAYLKAEENKSLSRNQVDNFQKVFLNRKAEYEQTKSDYSVVLSNYNQFQTNHYSTSLPNWSFKGEEIEKLRYEVLKSTFTNLSELCRSLASKFLEMADKIELESERIDCKKDCLVLISKEKTGDIPPGAISFKDFDSDRNGDLSVTENKVKKVSSSSSDSMSIVNGKKKNSIPEVKMRTESSKQDMDSSSNIATNLSTSSGSSNGITGGNAKSFSFSKFFGASKKTKNMSTCFKCGTIGHIARNCTNSQSYSESINGNFVTGRVFVRNKRNQNFIDKSIICYKCNKVGHIARNCESESAVCYGCGKEGHLFKECVSSSKKVCYNCNSTEHLVKDCPVNETEEHISNYVDATSHTDEVSFRNDQCYNCKDFGHIARNCPKKSNKESVCYRCNRPGHLARNCNFN